MPLDPAVLVATPVRPAADLKVRHREADVLQHAYVLRFLQGAPGQGLELHRKVVRQQVVLGPEDGRSGSDVIGVPSILIESGDQGGSQATRHGSRWVVALRTWFANTSSGLPPRAR